MSMNCLMGSCRAKGMEIRFQTLYVFYTIGGNKIRRSQKCIFSNPIQFNVRRNLYLTCVDGNVYWKGFYLPQEMEQNGLFALEGCILDPSREHLKRGSNTKVM